MTTDPTPRSATADYLQRTPTGSWVYRRRVPSNLIEIMGGRREVKLALGTRDHLVASMVSILVTEEVDRVFDRYERQLNGGGDPKAFQKHPFDILADEAKIVSEDALSRLRVILKPGDEGEEDTDSGFT